MFSNLLPHILEHYQTELDETRQALAQKPGDELLDEYAQQMAIAVADWKAIISRTHSDAIIFRRQRSAWQRRNASYDDMTELGQKIHALACNELDALDAVDHRQR